MTADAVGGVWRFAVDLARAIGRHGVRVSLVVLGPSPTTAQRREAASIDAMALYDAPFRLEWMEEPWDDVDAAGEWLLELERQLAPDIVHLNGYVHASLPWRAPVMVTGHSCVLSWWSAVHGRSAPPAWSRYAAAVTRGLRSASLVTAPGSAMLEALQQHYGPLRRTSVIHNGSAAAPDGSAKEPLVMTAGRLWDAAKNVAAVCAVAPRLPWPVYIAGPLDGPGDLSVRCDSVHYLGRLPAAQVIEWMSRASVYALPARYEPFGLSILEAALCGCALVLGDIQSLREIWDDAAVYVPPDDQAALESALVSLAERDAYREEMAARALVRARQFTIERMSAAYHDTYTELAREVRPVLSLGAL